MTGLPTHTDHIAASPKDEGASYPNPDLGMTLFTQSRDIILFVRLRDGRILEANPAAERAYGYSRSELLELTVIDLRAPETHPQVKAQMQQANTSGILFETLHRRKDGTVFPVEVSSVGTEFGQEPANLSIVRNISERSQRKLVEQNLAESEARYRKLVELSPDVVAVLSQGKIVFINQAGIDLLGARSAGELVEKSILDFTPLEDWPLVFQRSAQMAQGLPVPPLEEKFIRPDGTLVEIEIRGTPISYLGQPAVLMVGRDVTGRKQAELDLQRRMVELEALNAVALAGTEAASTDDLLDRVAAIIRQKLYPDYFGVAFLDPEARELVYHHSFTHNCCLAADRVSLECGIGGAVARSGLIRRVDDVRTDPDYLAGNPDTRSELCVPIIIDGRVIGVINLENEQAGSFTEADERLVTAIAGELGTAVEKIRLLEAERSRRQELEALERISAVLRTKEDKGEVLEAILERVMAALNLLGAGLAFRDPQSGDLVADLYRGEWSLTKGIHLPQGQGISHQVAVTQHYYLNNNFRSDPNMKVPGLIPRNKCLLCVALIADGRTQGLLYLGRNSAFLPPDVHLAIAIADTLASALHRIDLHEQTRRQLDRLMGLRAVDQSILSRLNLDQTLEVLLENITGLLHVDAADILLYNSNIKTLKAVARRGLSSLLWEETLSLGKSHAGRVAQSREMEFLPDLSLFDDSLTEKIRLIGESFTSYVAVPLIAKGELKGVLQIFNRARLDASPDWMGFLEALADQSAIAINSVQLFDEQQQTHLRLTRAYEDTIDGWSRALDLRDEETEGHSRRVTDLTLGLARRLGVSDEALVHIRRGARLHDIGKMGIPDRILLKTGKLTGEEWEIMRQHPTFAADLLYPIEFLGPALEIPFSHHEKWDGTGYPQGLKGQETPLAARIFAVIDVWDALTHDRPYRPAWTKAQALEYIREQSGKHFDPGVVEEFLAQVGPVA